MTIETWMDHLFGFAMGILVTVWAYSFYFKYRTLLNAPLRWPWQKAERSPEPTEPRRMEELETLTPEQAKTQAQDAIAQSIHKFVRENTCTPEMFELIASYLSQMGCDGDDEAMWMEAGFKFLEKKQFAQAAHIFGNLLRRHPGHEAYRRLLNSALRGDNDDGNVVGAFP